MSEIKVKPITDQRPPLGKLFGDIVLKDLPIHRFLQRKEQERKKMKL